VTCRVRKYEFVSILDPGVDEAAAGEHLERFAKLVRDNGGEVSQQENWGRRKFAYEILKKTEGSYLYLRFRGNNKVVEELNRVVRFDEKVLRILLVLDDEAEMRNAAARRGAGANEAPVAPPVESGAVM
jgi:small subunit ribosomal protein S6